MWAPPWEARFSSYDPKTTTNIPTRIGAVKVVDVNTPLIGQKSPTRQTKHPNLQGAKTLPHPNLEGAKLTPA